MENWDKMELLDELCTKVASEIDNVNLNNMRIFENLGQMIGTPKDNEMLRNKIKNIQEDLNEQLFQITRNVKEINAPTFEKNPKINLQRERIEEAFKATLLQFNNLQKDITAKQKNHILVQIDISKRSSDDHILLDSTQSQVLENIKEEEDRLLKQQAEMKNIQTDIVDIHQIFCDLGEMTERQGDAVDTVQQTIEEVAATVKEGTKKLDEIKTQTRSRRKTLLYLIVILIIIIVGILIGVISHFCK